MEVEEDIGMDVLRLSQAEVDALAEFWDNSQSQRVNLNTVHWWLRQVNPHPG